MGPRDLTGEFCTSGSEREFTHRALDAGRSAFVFVWLWTLGSCPGAFEGCCGVEVLTLRRGLHARHLPRSRHEQPNREHSRGE